jgi:hypothetical protein
MRIRPLAALLVGALPLLAAAPRPAAAQDAAEPERVRPGAESAPDSFVPVAIFRVSGVRDSVGAATVFQCTNVGAGNATVGVVVRDFDGALDCNQTFGPLPPNQSVTIATRNTAVFAEDAFCGGPGIDGGSATITADSAGSQRLICTVHLIDPAAASPLFASTLDLHRP